MIKERSNSMQFLVNMAASFMTFVVGLGIRFVLTPYIVRTLGTEAYGFIGLSSNILSYTGLVTIALNSMAGRFVTIKYSAGDVESANRYYASVFYSNIILAAVILLFSIGCVAWLEYMIDIPERLVLDVKLLFALLAINNIVGLVFGIWGVSTFIKNRLDLSNIRGIIGNFMNVAILVALFSLFAPHIWYMGVAGFVMTFYTTWTNRRFARMLTPELVVKRGNFEWGKVVELLKSGAWNLVSKLGEILGQGLDLLIANVCIGATAMGYFALTKNVPFLILSLFQTISGVFAPILTNLYAQGNTDSLIREFQKSIRILGFFTTIPLAILYIWGSDFYSLWLPTENSYELQLLTVLGTLGMVFSMPLESLWNIFTITNKLKVSTMVQFCYNIVVFLVVLISVMFTDDLKMRLYILAGTRTVIGITRSLFFLPIYGAYCLDLPKKIFYEPLIKSCSALFVACFFSFVLKQYVVIESWLAFGIICIITIILCMIVNYKLVLLKNDVEFIKKLLPFK